MRDRMSAMKPCACTFVPPALMYATAAGGLVWGIVDITSGDGAETARVEAALLPGGASIRGTF